MPPLLLGIFIKISWHNHIIIFFFFFCLIRHSKFPWETCTINHITPSIEIVFIAHHLPYSHKGEVQWTTISNHDPKLSQNEYI